MTSIQSTTQILLYLPHVGRPIDRAEVEAVARQAETQGLTLLRKDPCVLACREARAVSGQRSLQRAIIDVFEGVAESRRSFRTDSESFDWAEAHSVAERDAQFYNIIEISEEGVRIESDPLGMKPLYRAELSGGTVFASRILDLLQIEPALIRPVDELGLYQLMAHRGTFGGRTLHRRIKRARTGDCYRWGRDGLSVLRARRLPLPPVDGTLFVDQAMSRIKDAVIDSIDRRTRDSTGTMALALSGGFDSRLLAAAAREMRLPVRAFCFGRDHHPEVGYARAVAKALDLPLTMLPTPSDNSIERLPLHLEAAEGTIDLATTHFTNLFAMNPRKGEPLLHGFLGDMLAGYHMRLLSSADLSDLDSMANGIVRWFDGGSFSCLFERLFERSAGLDTLRSDVREDLVEGDVPFQSFRLWDAENRQRHFVGGHIPVIGRVFREIVPFYDRRLFAVWMSMPPIGLDRRMLFRRLLERYYPALAEIPHAEESHAIVPRLRWQLSVFARDLRLKAGAGLAASGLARSFGLDAVRQDRNIWLIPNLAGPRQQAHMLGRIGELRPVLSTVLDLEISAAFRDVLDGRLQALRAVFLVSEYAAWLRDRVASGPRLAAGD